AVAEVDADVVDALAAAAEEHQVAGGQRITVHLLPVAGHVARDPGQFDAQRGPEDVVDQPAAVEAAVGRAATPAVGRAEQGHRPAQQLLDPAFTPGRRRLPGVLRPGGFPGDELVEV